MTVSSLTLWKAAGRAMRAGAPSPEGNRYIGETLRDLYAEDDLATAGEARFEDLLSRLDEQEQQQRARRKSDH